MDAEMYEAINRLSTVEYVANSGDTSGELESIVKEKLSVLFSSTTSEAEIIVDSVLGELRNKALLSEAEMKVLRKLFLSDSQLSFSGNIDELRKIATTPGSINILSSFDNAVSRTLMSPNVFFRGAAGADYGGAIGAAFGAVFGMAFGGYPGAALGAFVGQAVGRAAGRYIGSGGGRASHFCTTPICGDG